jgi:prefoldin subunit 5
MLLLLLTHNLPAALCELAADHEQLTQQLQQQQQQQRHSTPATLEALQGRSDQSC